MFFGKLILINFILNGKFQIHNVRKSKQSRWSISWYGSIEFSYGSIPYCGAFFRYFVCFDMQSHVHFVSRYSGVATIFPRGRPTFMGPQGNPYQKLKTHRVWFTMFWEGVQNHEQEKKITKNIRLRRPIIDLRGPNSCFRGLKHERTHKAWAEWVNKG